ncbi:hypothetical protein [Micromonospora endolithica]|uniref:Uncharacterized protein n=1 Tax=Micromonospora endolithica TaxID=230091 RepID=A0A3A9ZAP8_9ACTN|nr:hypothetical protein [Micromonospora endolithica]RKN45368.1 hypothetical protein D7223_17310 [Micromonospora endolithica]TWJ22927.1 hypothetical protein JD76_03050 [Micromonospora endolithica]
MGTWSRLSWVTVAVLMLAGCTTGRSTAPVAEPGTTAPTSAPASAPTGCADRVERGPLPVWADAGFSGDARAPHVVGAQDEIAAVLFGNPLRVARTDGSTNKILWVARPAPTPPVTEPATLRITATLAGSGIRVTREVPGGPGPSVVDLPRAGCWHLELSWSGRTDTMDLGYAES